MRQHLIEPMDFPGDQAPSGSSVRLFQILVLRSRAVSSPLVNHNRPWWTSPCSHTSKARSRVEVADCRRESRNRSSASCRAPTVFRCSSRVFPCSFAIRAALWFSQTANRARYGDRGREHSIASSTAAAPAGLRRHQRHTRSARLTGRARIGSPAWILAQILGEGRGTGVAFLRFFAQAFLGDRLQVARRLRLQLRRRHWFVHSSPA